MNNTTFKARATALALGLGLAAMGGTAHAAGVSSAVKDPGSAIFDDRRDACRARLRRTRPIDTEPVEHVLREVRAPVTGSDARPHAIRLKGRE
ncbi:MAG: hypothetical protein AAFU65_15195, partial [Pseudomonadota bacterium]